MGSNGARNTSDDNKGGSSYSSQLKTIQKKQKVVDFIVGGGITGAVLKGVENKIGEIKEQGRRNKLTSQFDSEEGVKRTYTPPNNDKGNNNSNAVVPLTTAAAMSPTKAEVSQATATDATNTTLAEDYTLRKKKTKATGRSSTILTSSRGVRSDEGLTLGKKSLLGS